MVKVGKYFMLYNGSAVDLVFSAAVLGAGGGVGQVGLFLPTPQHTHD